MNKENLIIAVDYLLENDGKYEVNMRQFIENCWDIKPSGAMKLNPCNSVGCILGHLSMSGIDSLSPNDLGGCGDWFDYAFTVFGIDDWGKDLKQWSWVFGEEWETKDKTFKGAAARILWLLKHSDDFDGQLEIPKTEIEIHNYKKMISKMIDEYTSKKAKGEDWH